MDSELAKLVEAAKLTEKAAQRIEQLKPGSFCLHKSWGFGRVADWNLLLNQLVIDFQSKKAHPMQLAYAAEHVTPIPPGHFLARKADDLAAIKAEVKSDPAGVVRNILEGMGGRATVTQISEVLVGDVFTEPEWKRWWDSTKKQLKSTGLFTVPTKKTEPVQLRGEAVAHADELIQAFTEARQPKDQATALDQIIKFHHDFKEPEAQLQPLIGMLEESAAKNQKLHPALSFELIIGRDDLLARASKLRPTRPELTLARLILEEEPRLALILPKMPAGKERRVIQAFPAALGDRWKERALKLMHENQPRLVSAVTRVFAETGCLADLHTAFERSLRERSATSEMLAWLIKERDEKVVNLINPELLVAILAAIERDQHNESRGNRLRDLLLDDKQLVPDMFRDVEPEAARDSMRRLQLTPVFDDLTKRSLMARIIKLYPEMESLVSGDTREEKVEALIVSWSSLDKRKTEYEDLVNKKIPENTKEIALARSYGDLRENFEFKAAKEMQAVLMRRKTELEQMLHSARGTGFENPDTSQVSIGTIVSLREEKSGQEETYTVLGAWDGDPDRHIISYKTVIGQALLGHRAGEVVELNTDHGTGRFTIRSIEAAPPDEAPAAEMESVALGEAAATR